MTVTPRWTALLKRFGLATLFLLVLVYLIPHDQVRSAWQAHPSLKPHDGDDGLEMPTEIDPDALQTADGVQLLPSDFENRIKTFQEPVGEREWGLMGAQVKKLGAWAKSVGGGPFESPKHLDEAVMTRFPYLKKSKMYKPWSYVREEDKDGLNKAGMVMCVGSSNFHLASHLITSLRNVFHSNMPIEVAYAGDNDLPPKYRGYMQTLGVDISFIDLLKFFPEAKSDLEGSGWAMKAFSILASKHKRVMLVDADALFLTDPSTLFETHPQLNQTGILLYHDRAVAGGSEDAVGFLRDQIAAAGHEPSKYLSDQSLFYQKNSFYEADSGLVAMDKSRPDVFMGLLLVTWLNTKSVREAVTYKLYHGDKETFWIAPELCGLDYYFQPWYAGSMGNVRGDAPADPEAEPSELCTTHMLHMDHTGETPFWINGGFYQHKEFPESGFADITHYWRGNTDLAGRPNWWWEDHNVACLKVTGVKPVPPNMLDNLRQMYENAGKVDEAIKQLPS